jgi:hypothetical protein
MCLLPAVTFKPRFVYTLSLAYKFNVILTTSTDYFHKLQFLIMKVEFCLFWRWNLICLHNVNKFQSLKF